MKRNPRKVKWTKAYRVLHGKDLSADSTFTFERRRNRPERYNRPLVQKTVTAIKKVEEIRIRRAERHHSIRMEKNTRENRRVEQRELEQQIHLVRAPSTMDKNAGELEPETKMKVLLTAQATGVE